MLYLLSLSLVYLCCYLWQGVYTLAGVADHGGSSTRPSRCASRAWHRRKRDCVVAAGRLFWHACGVLAECVQVSERGNAGTQWAHTQHRVLHHRVERQPRMVLHETLRSTNPRAHVTGLRRRGVEPWRRAHIAATATASNSTSSTGSVPRVVVVHVRVSGI